MHHLATNKHTTEHLFAQLLEVRANLVRTLQITALECTITLVSKSIDYGVREAECKEKLLAFHVHKSALHNCTRSLKLAPAHGGRACSQKHVGELAGLVLVAAGVVEHLLAALDRGGGLLVEVDELLVFVVTAID
jgi:Cu/Zn superoxide dismutase